TTAKEVNWSSSRLIGEVPGQERRVTSVAPWSARVNQLISATCLVLRERASDGTRDSPVFSWDLWCWLSGRAFSHLGLSTIAMHSSPRLDFQASYARICHETFSSLHP